MGDTKVQGLARVREYNVYIDQDDKADKFTASTNVYATHFNPEDRTNFDRDRCMAEYRATANKLGYSIASNLFSSRLDPTSICPEVSPVNSFELASKTPIRKSVFKNASGEEFKVGSIVGVSGVKEDIGASRCEGTDDSVMLGKWLSLPIKGCSLGTGPYIIADFIIAGFTDDPKRKNFEDMSNLPDEKRKYAVIYALLAPAQPPEDNLLYDIHEVPLDRLSIMFSRESSKPEADGSHDKEQIGARRR